MFHVKHLYFLQTNQNKTFTSRFDEKQAKNLKQGENLLQKHKKPENVSRETLFSPPKACGRNRTQKQRARDDPNDQKQENQGFCSIKRHFLDEKTANALLTLLNLWFSVDRTRCLWYHYNEIIVNWRKNPRKGQNRAKELCFGKKEGKKTVFMVGSSLVQ